MTIDSTFKQAKHSYVVTEYNQFAIYDHPWDGPCFGTGPDIWVNINPNKPIGHIVRKCYQPSVINISGIFRWIDWEIFQVIRKDNGKGINNYDHPVYDNEDWFNF
ncbi:274_t:CDS:2 [Diversispora eburnea]|uniref:274_t:CDS:1 n=1 Tax=Diversispora eburnea TaxID=1213867 RepID=A0A9N8VII2_9GLOM|nr:274_t:CDS:2 [Diversispora eburnea]